MTEKKFEVSKDSFETSVKSLDELEDSAIWRSIAEEYFNENPDEIQKQIECLKVKLEELGKLFVSSSCSRPITDSEF